MKELFVCILVLSNLFSFSQNKNKFDQNELFVFEDEYGELQEYIDNPLLINCASFKELSEFPFFSNQVARNIHKHIHFYGNIYTTEQLKLIPGIKIHELELYKSLIRFSDCKPQPKVDFSGILKKDLSEQNTSTPLGFSSIVKAKNISRIDILNLIIDHDQNEPLKQRPNFISAGAKLNLSKLNLFIGDYRIKLGYGTSNFDGFNFSSEFISNTKSYDQVKTHGSLSEYGYKRGLAAQFGLFGAENTIWLSTKPYSTTIKNNTVTSIYNNSNFTDSLSLSKRNNLNEYSIGFKSSFSYKNFKFMIIPQLVWFDKNIQLTKQHQEAYELNTNTGFHLTYSKRDFSFGTEICLNNFNDFEMNISTKKEFNDIAFALRSTFKSNNYINLSSSNALNSEKLNIQPNMSFNISETTSLFLFISLFAPNHGKDSKYIAQNKFNSGMMLSKQIKQNYLNVKLRLKNYFDYDLNDYFYQVNNQKIINLNLNYSIQENEKFIPIFKVVWNKILDTKLTGKSIQFVLKYTYNKSNIIINSGLFSNDAFENTSYVFFYNSPYSSNTKALYYSGKFLNVLFKQELKSRTKLWLNLNLLNYENKGIKNNTFEIKLMLRQIF